MASNAKRKCCAYLVDYIKFGFVPCPSNFQLPNMSIVQENSFK